MNTGTTCINGAEIASALWKIGQNPFNAGMITPFTQGDTATALLKVELLDCDSFEGLTLEAFVQVPNPPDNSIVKIHATIDSDNKAIFTLPTELLWYPGDYDINFVFTDGSKVNYSNVLNASYQVLENPALAGEDPPTILPGDVAEYERLIAELNAENTKAEINLPLLEAENDRAEANIIAAGDINTELEGTITDAGTAKTELEGTITDSETAKANLEQTITDSETAKTNLEGTITDAGQAQSDLQDKIDEVPALIQSIADEGDAQVARVISEGDTQETRVTDQGNTEVARVQSQGDTSVQAVKDQEVASIIAVGDKGDEEYQRLNDLIQTSPTGGNAILLDGRTRTSFEEDIESRQYALDNRLIYAFDPSKRNIENINYGMYIKNPLTNGDGTIKSEDADSMSGVFDDKSGSFYCGEGYENLCKNLNWSTLGDSTITTEVTDKEGVTTLKGNTRTGGGNFIYSDVQQTTTAFLNAEIYNKSNFDIAYEYKIPSTKIIIPANSKKEIKIEKINDATNQLLFSSTESTAFSYEIEIKQVISETFGYVPFVKDTAPDGKLIIKEPWTSSNHTIINLDENLDEQEFYADGTQLNLHLKSDGVTYNNYVSNSLIYEGVLTTQEKADEIAKIKSGQYSVENTGVYEPVQGAKRRANEYGQTKNYVYVNSNTTDIQLVETDKTVYTTVNGVTKIDFIDSLGAITGDGGIVDVNGYIRLATNVKTKVVIENE